MQPQVGLAGPAVRVAPPFPAELVIPSQGWISRLARNGVVALDRPEVHLGLLATNDVVFRDPHVSRLHAVIRWTPAGYEIEDLNSTWGTYVQGQRVFGRMLLPPGAMIRLGTLDMRFQPVPQPAAAPIAHPPVSAAYAPPFRPSPVPPAPVAAPAPMRQPATSRLRAWLRRQAPKRYWRVFLVGLLAYIAANLLVNLDLNLHAIPLVILLASAVVPITFVVFCYEEGAFADMPATVVGLTFVSGAVMGLLVAGFLEDIFLVDVPILGALMVGVIEEGAKAGAVIWFLRDKRLRSELDGLVLGAAAGMGFATLETAGYGFNGFLAGYTKAMAAHGPATPGALDHAIGAGISAMTIVLVLRMVLAVFGHGVWTAIVCAAIWRERGPAVLRISGGVVLAFVLSVTLHALWDSVGSFLPLSLLFWPVVAFSGLWILRFFIHEAVDRAKLGLYAPPPVPLVDALGAYLRHPFRRPTLQPIFLAAPAAPVPAGVGFALPPHPPAYSAGFPPNVPPNVPPIYPPSIYPPSGYAATFPGPQPIQAAPEPPAPAFGPYVAAPVGPYASPYASPPPTMPQPAPVAAPLAPEASISTEPTRDGDMPGAQEAPVDAREADEHVAATPEPRPTSEAD